MAQNAIVKPVVVTAEGNQARTILLKRGLDANFGSVALEVGEPAFVTDTGKLYVGDGTTNVLINKDYGTAADKDTGDEPGDIPVIGEDGKLDPSLIPSASITDVFVVADEAERLALTDAGVGDVAVQTDTQETYILEQEPASEAGNWVKIVAAGYVTSVAGKTGDVILKIADIAGLADAIAAKAPINSPTFTGSPKAPTPPAADNSTKIATTAFVKAAIQAMPDAPVTSVNGEVGEVILDGSHIEITGYEIATEDVALEPTDTVDEALGKLEKSLQVVDGGTF